MGEWINRPKFPSRFLNEKRRYDSDQKAVTIEKTNVQKNKHVIKIVIKKHKAVQRSQYVADIRCIIRGVDMKLIYDI
jgi:hypothetical protein